MEGVEMTSTHCAGVPLVKYRHVVLVSTALVFGAACVDPPPPPGSGPEPEPGTAGASDTVVVRTVTDTVVVPDPQTEQQLAQLQLQLLEKDAQIQRLQAQLDDATREVVRSMARLQTVASRAEAASAMAEAEVALEQLRTAAGGRATPEIAQVERLLEESTAAFNEENYGGSLYLANRAKGFAGAGRGRLLGSGQESLLPGETLFTESLQLRTVRRSNVRGGPGTEFAVVFTLDAGAALVGHSYVGQWVRISTEDGQGGWIFQSLVESRSRGS
jgi:hypothetical protein